MTRALRTVTRPLTCSDGLLTAPHGPPSGGASTREYGWDNRVPGDQRVRGD
ncbi:protein of unknown function [Modestobacter italicus]|uniref:Uncharacterized protein n=1 Tax=Modestobacter italicus (strain DSM 44449 / CECT 9708 / BC 501) TaxID=2732864 RepID=I4EZB6_MODI5|nr:protein of unknown function [Modestobacter marinus]